MTVPAEPPPPAELRLETNLEEGRPHVLGDAEPDRGNVLWLVHCDDGPDRVLKVYRRRRNPVFDVLESAAQRVLERKRGTTPAARRATERKLLDLWSSAGVDVPLRFHGPAPAGHGPHSLWMEHCPGPVLSVALADREVPWERRLALLRRFAADLGRRQALALARGNPRLCHEHATLNHVIVCGDRLVHFDLEGGFSRSADVLDCVGLELAGYLRSLEKVLPERFDETLRAFADAHGHRDLLQRAAEHAVHARTPSRLLRRLRDRRLRGPRGKTWVMRRLLEVLR